MRSTRTTMIFSEKTDIETDAGLALSGFSVWSRLSPFFAAIRLRIGKNLVNRGEKSGNSAILLVISRQEIAMLYPLATLEADKLNAVQALEQEIGRPVVALAAVDADTANLPKEDLKKLQALEDKLDVVLVAMRPS